MEELHIGTEIRKVSKKRRLGATFIAKQLGKTRANVNHIFTRKSIDSDLLFQLSMILDFNFFNLYSNALRDKLGLERTMSRKEIAGEISGKIEQHEKNSATQIKYISLLEEKIAALQSQSDSTKTKKVKLHD